MHLLTRKICLLIAVLLFCVNTQSIAAGETISFSGSVAAKNEIHVLADKQGYVSSLVVKTGQRVNQGQPILTLATEKVFSPTDGTVSLLNCKPGDSTESIINRYGALMFVEDRYSFEIVASVDNAYNTADNKLVHPGEVVRVVCNDSKHSGTGFITQIDKNQYNVLITSGMFVIGESVNIYRSRTTEMVAQPEDSMDSEEADDEVAKKQSVKESAPDKIGKGTVERVTPYAIKGEGNVVEVYVQEGDTVKSGDVLCEIIDAGVSGYTEYPNMIVASSQGVIGSLRVSPGDNVKSNDIVAVIYPSDEVIIKGNVSEFEVQSLSVNDDVEIEILSNQGESRVYPGKISSISLSSSQAKDKNDGSITYEVYVDFETTDKIFYGMSAIVNVNK